MLTGKRRGPQRSESSRVAILAAAAEQFAAHGYDHLTIEGIAAAAHVGKTTVYRWWPSKGALIADCLAEGLLLPDWFVPEADGELADDLTAWVENVVAFLGSPGNDGMLRSLVIAAAEHEDVAARLNERLGLWTVLADRLGPDPVETGEALVGALVVRSLRRQPFDEAYAARLVATVLAPVRGD